MQAIANSLKNTIILLLSQNNRMFEHSCSHGISSVVVDIKITNTMILKLHIMRPID